MQISEYRGVRRIGRGLDGDVWLATAPDGSSVALKFLDLPVTAALQFARREIALAAQIDHPHVLAARSILCEEDRVALVLPWAAGGSLSDLIGAHGPLSLEQTLTVLIPVADVLAVAHERGVVHGDLSPANILLTGDGRPLVADLGSGSLAIERGRPAGGTPGCIAPEVAKGASPSAASDIFSWAAVALWCLTGRPAWNARDLKDVVVQAAVGQWPDPGEMTGSSKFVAALRAALSDVPSSRPGAASLRIEMARSGQPAPLPLGERALRRPDGQYPEGPFVGDPAEPEESDDLVHTQQLPPTPTRRRIDVPTSAPNTIDEPAALRRIRRLLDRRPAGDLGGGEVGGGEVGGGDFPDGQLLARPRPRSHRRPDWSPGWWRPAAGLVAVGLVVAAAVYGGLAWGRSSASAPATATSATSSGSLPTTAAPPTRQSTANTARASAVAAPSGAVPSVPVLPGPAQSASITSGSITSGSITSGSVPCRSVPSGSGTSATRSTDAAPVSGPGSSAARSTAWTSVVAGLDAARARALVTRDPAVLSSVYSTGSTAWAADLATIRSLAADGLRVSDARHLVRSVVVRSARAGEVLVTVVDELPSYAVTDRSGAVVSRTPARARSSHELVLVLVAAGGYRIRTVRDA